MARPLSLGPLSLGWVFLAVLGLLSRGLAFSHAHEGGEEHHRHGLAIGASHGHAHGACHGHAHRHVAPEAPGLPDGGLPPAEAPEGEHSHVTGVEDAARAARPVPTPGADGLLAAAAPAHPASSGVLGAGADHRPVLPGPGTGPPTVLVADDLLAHLVSRGSGLLL